MLNPSCSPIRCVEKRADGGGLFVRACFDKNGLKQGDYYEYFENGHVAYQAEYKNDSLNGMFRRFYEDGKVQSIVEYRMNLIWSVVEERDRSGEVFVGSSVRNGNGTAHFYDRDGDLRRFGGVRNGLKDGYWKFFLRAGVIDSVLYVEGRRKGLGKVEVTF